MPNLKTPAKKNVCGDRASIGELSHGQPDAPADEAMERYQLEMDFDSIAALAEKHGLRLEA